MFASSSTSNVRWHVRAWPYALTLIGMLGAVTFNTATMRTAPEALALHLPASRCRDDRPPQELPPALASRLASQRQRTDFAIYVTISAWPSAARQRPALILNQLQRQNLSRTQFAAAGL
jgi:hypothetical protein